MIIYCIFFVKAPGNQEPELEFRHFHSGLYQQQQVPAGNNYIVYTLKTIERHKDNYS